MTTHLSFVRFCTLFTVIVGFFMLLTSSVSATVPNVSLTTPTPLPITADGLGNAYPQIDFDLSSGPPLISPSDCTFTAEDEFGTPIIPVPTNWGNPPVFGSEGFNTTFNPILDRTTNLIATCTELVSGDTGMDNILITILDPTPTPPPPVTVTPSANPVNGGDIISVTVTSDDVDSCDLKAYNSGGTEFSQTNWTTVSPIPGDTTITLNNITLSQETRFEATCTRFSDGLSSVGDATVTLNAPWLVDVALTPSQTTGIIPGSSITVDMVLDGEPEWCTLTSSNGSNESGWSNQGTFVAPSGSATFNINITGDVTITADCWRFAGTNSDDRDVASVNLSVQPGLGVDFRTEDARISNNYVADPVAGTYTNVYGEVNVRNIGDIDFPGGEIPLYMELISLQPGLPNPPFTLTAPRETLTPQTFVGGAGLRGTVNFPPSGESHGYRDTSEFEPPIPFGTHNFCVYGARWQSTGLYRSEDVDTSNNDFCFNATLPVPQPPMSIEILQTGTEDIAQVIRVNDAVDVRYDIDVAYPLNCTVRGPGGINVGPFNAWTTAEVLLTSNPLTSTSKFVLECTEPVTSTVFTMDAIVEVIPDFEEI